MILRNLPWLACGLLAVLAAFLKFCVPGYSFSALVCCGLIAIIAFYTLVSNHVLRRAVTVIFAIGIALVAVTESYIIRYSFGSPSQDIQYIIVLGAKVRDFGPSMSLWDRIYGAADYLTEHPEDIAVVSGGQGTDEPMTEAQAMKDALIDLGIEPERIWMEEKATSTWENLTFSLDLIEETTGSRPERIGVVSSEYHLFRASLFAKECGVEFVGIPAKTSRPGQKINHFMREVAGVWHFLLLGGQYD